MTKGNFDKVSAGIHRLYVWAFQVFLPIAYSDATTGLKKNQKVKARIEGFKDPKNIPLNENIVNSQLTQEQQIAGNFNASVNPSFKIEGQEFHSILDQETQSPQNPKKTLFSENFQETPREQDLPLDIQHKRRKLHKIVLAERPKDKNEITNSSSSSELTQNKEEEEKDDEDKDDDWLLTVNPENGKKSISEIQKNDDPELKEDAQDDDVIFCKEENNEEDMREKKEKQEEAMAEEKKKKQEEKILKKKQLETKEKEEEMFFFFLLCHHQLIMKICIEGK